MGVGLQPLEFSECLADSPVFREKLLRHEKELERTSQQIKRLIKEVKDVVHAAKRLGAAQLALADSMEQFEFPCIGASMTEDERVISRSLKQFAMLMRDIEGERERMLGRAHDQIIEPLERFRKDHIGAVKISSPMCLDMIRGRLQGGAARYSALPQYLRDVRLMFRNAYLYNPPDSQIYKDAKRLEEFFDAQLVKLLPEYAYWQDSDGDSPPKRARYE